MKFLVDRCAGTRLAAGLREHGHDVFEARSISPDPGDAVLLEVAAADGRVVVTIDTDFGRLVYAGGAAHRGIVRLPDVPYERKVQLMSAVLVRHTDDLANGAVITVRGDRIRVSWPPSPDGGKTRA
ncbi:MAG: DUF5615 family PIN-like protein [Tepidisphaerales bacterium]